MRKEVFVPILALTLSLVVLGIARAAFVGPSQAPPNGDGTLTTSNGNVGIGTTGPLVKLHIAGGSTVPAGELGSALVTGSTTAMRLAFGVNNTSTMYSWIQSVENGIITRDLALNPIGGNVGIGTTSPDYKLNIESG